MSNDEKHLMDRLINVAFQAALNAEIAKSTSQQWSEDLDISTYRQNNLWPGGNYILAGHSYFTKYRIIGTDFETRRAGHIAFVCQQKGDRHHCVTVADALSNEGFMEFLDEDERDWLDSLPDDTLIGPAYDRVGRHIPTAFAIWRSLEMEAPIHVEIAHR